MLPLPILFKKIFIQNSQVNHNSCLKVRAYDNFIIQERSRQSAKGSLTAKLSRR